MDIPDDVPGTPLDGNDFTMKINWEKFTWRCPKGHEMESTKGWYLFAYEWHGLHASTQACPACLAEWLNANIPQMVRDEKPNED